MKQWIVTGLALAILLPISGIAQDSAQQKDEQQKRLQAIARLKPGNLIQVHAQGLGEIAGKYHSSNSDSLFITVDMVERGVPIVAIDALWVRGRATKSGAIIGGVGVVAIGLGLGIAVVLSSGVDESVSCSGGFCEASPVAIGFGLAAAGALVGAGVGTAFQKWHLRYRSPGYDSHLYTSLSEEEFAAYWDDGEGYSDLNMEESQPSRVRFSIAPDISRGGVNFSASFAF